MVQIAGLYLDPYGRLVHKTSSRTKQSSCGKKREGTATKHENAPKFSTISQNKEPLMADGYEVVHIPQQQSDGASVNPSPLCFSSNALCILVVTGEYIATISFHHNAYTTHPQTPKLVLG